jgi:photosystem II stability/assembly factor-like uncharacterized protein
MADRRDDLDSWLDGRIEPMPPPPGTFDLIKRRARRRKYRRLAVTAGAAAVIVAAAVTVPQIVNLPVLNPATANQAANGRTSTPTRTVAGGASAASSSATQAVPSPAAGPVPLNFRPTSVTFIGPHIGWVIGQAGTPGHCATAYCTSVARTGDAGTSWSGGPAPVTSQADGAAGVSQIRFLDAQDGWAFGPQLYATHDGGRTWAQVGTSGLRVTGLETVGDRAFALFASCTGTGPAFAGRCASYTLYSSPAARDDWTPVGPATTGLAGRAATMMLTGTRGYLLAPDGMLYSGPVNGPAPNGAAPWRPVKAIPCPVGTPLADGQPTGALLAVADPAHLVLVCASSSAPGTQQAKHVFTSADGGISWQNAAAAPSLGLATSVAATPAGVYVLATGRGIDVRPAGSAAWQAATLDGPVPAGGFGYVGMTTETQGVAVPADPAAGTVWFTFDGGKTWAPSRISS